MLFADEARRVVRAEQIVGPALVDERIFPEGFRHFRAARLAHQLHVIHVRARVGPVIRARQAARRTRADRTGARRQLTFFQRFRDVAQQRLDVVPAIERGLQRRGDRAARE